MTKTRKYVVFTELILLITILFCGCSVTGAKRQLNTLGIVVGLAIDESKNENELLMTAQLVRNDSVGQNASGQSSSNNESDLGKAYWNISVEGKNLLESMRNAIHMTNRDLYIAQNHIVVISKNIAKAGIGKYLDYFFRDQETRYDVDLVISDGNASEILNTESHLEKLPAQDLYKMIRMQKDSGISPKCTLFDFVQNMKIPNKSNIVPIVSISKIKDDKKSPFLSVSGSAIFKEDKMVSSLDENLTRGILWLTEKKTGGVLTIPYQNRSVSVEILNGKGDFTANVIDDAIVVNVDISADCTLGEFQNGEIISEKTLDDIEILCSKKIAGELRTAFFILQNSGADVIGVGEYIYRHCYSDWKKISDNYESLFKSAKLNMEINVDITRTGSVIEAVSR